MSHYQNNFFGTTPIYKMKKGSANVKTMLSTKNPEGFAVAPVGGSYLRTLLPPRTKNSVSTAGVDKCDLSYFDVNPAVMHNYKSISSLQRANMLNKNFPRTDHKINRTLEGNNYKAKEQEIAGKCSEASLEDISFTKELEAIDYDINRTIEGNNFKINKISKTYSGVSFSDIFLNEDLEPIDHSINLNLEGDYCKRKVHSVKNESPKTHTTDELNEIFYNKVQSVESEDSKTENKKIKPENSKVSVKNMLAATISCIMLMASKNSEIPDDYLTWTENYLKCIKDNNKNHPPNVQGILSHIQYLRKNNNSKMEKEGTNTNKDDQYICLYRNKVKCNSSNELVGTEKYISKLGTSQRKKVVLRDK